MKNKVKNVIIVLICFFMLFISINYLGKLLRPTNTDGSVQAIKFFHELPDNSIEVIGYGSSHMWRDINPMVMYKNYGIGAYNYGANWQHFNTTLLFLEESLLTQSPKVVLIETFRVNDILKNENINGEIYYTREITDFEGKRKYLKQVFGNDLEKYFSYYFPLYIFHDNWINVDKINFNSINYAYKLKNYMGYAYSTDVKKVNIGKYYNFSQLELSDESVEILDRIMELSRQYDFDVIFFVSPYAGSSYNYGKAMEKYAKENGAVFIDFFKKIKEVGIDAETDFYDNGHLNMDGANKISDYLGRYISENYNVTDMRKIDNNLWEQRLNNK